MRLVLHALAFWHKTQATYSSDPVNWVTGSVMAYDSDVFRYHSFSFVSIMAGAFLLRWLRNTYTEQQKKRIFCIFGTVYKLGFKYWSYDMQGINDAWNMCIIKRITNGYLIWIMIIKGGNSGSNKIANNKGDFRDGVCLKPLNGFELKSLCVIIWTYRLLMKIKLSSILQGGPLWPSYIMGQLVGSVLKTGKKVSKHLF